MPAGHSRDRASRTVANIHAGGELVPLVRFGPFELDAIHLLLRGTSVVDWYRLHFNDREDIEAFIRLNEFDLRRAEDRKHIAGLKARALDYLRDHLRYRRVPERIAEADIVELIEFASGRGRRAYRFYACLVLKVIHLMHYVAGHELVGSLPITQAEVAVLLRAKVERVVRGLLERKFPLVAFSGNTKTHNSVLSKLMAKRESQAAQVFDKLRFRFVVDRLEDVPPLLVALIRELVPFNYTVPDQAK
ncbi:MAG: TIGR04552 family protein, partial [Myxococcota bacterium]